MSHGAGEHTKPKQASAVRKGTHVMLKGHPCKIVEMSTSKTGKHGHAKVKMVGICVLTDKKYAELFSSTHNCNEPVVTKTELQVTDVGESITCMDEEFNEVVCEFPKEPAKTEMLEAYESYVAKEKDMIITLLKAPGTSGDLEERVISWKESSE